MLARGVRLALVEIGIADAELAADIGDTYSQRRDIRMEPLPDAIDTVRWLRESGCRLALLTNGAGPAQRRKIARFGLGDLFDAILVEGEMGVGKPDERAGGHHNGGARPRCAGAVGAAFYHQLGL